MGVFTVICTTHLSTYSTHHIHNTKRSTPVTNSTNSQMLLFALAFSRFYTYDAKRSIWNAKRSIWNAKRSISNAKWSIWNAKRSICEILQKEDLHLKAKIIPLATNTIGLINIIIIIVIIVKNNNNISNHNINIHNKHNYRTKQNNPPQTSPQQRNHNATTTLALNNSIVNTIRFIYLHRN